MMHRLRDYMETVNEGHPGLGRLLAFSAIAVKARKALMIVAPSGTGKSQVTDALIATTAGSMKMDATTEAGLTPLQDALSDFTGLLVIDDMAQLNTQYRRLTTMTTLAGLCYGHTAEVHTGHQHLSIRNFNGAVMFGIQPVMLAPIVKHGSWEGLIQDKTLRYYHLYRPTEPTLTHLSVDIDYGLPIESVVPPDLKAKVFAGVLKIGKVQWSAGRILEHCSGLLCALAAMDGREEVNIEDILMFLELAKGLSVEKYIMDKQSLEGDRRLRTDFLYLLTEFVSYSTFTIESIMDNYKVSYATADRVMTNYSKMWKMVGKRPAKYAPSDSLLEIMSEVM